MMGTTAFLAFEPADEAPARAVAAELERHKWSVIGERPASAEGLAPTIASATIVVLIASPTAREDAGVEAVARTALANGRPILVVRTGPITSGSWLERLDLGNIVEFAGGSSEAMARLVEMARAASGRGKVIAMLNIKGGVGKTVLAANLFAAAHLADQRSISFIDLDPQHNLTQYFLSPTERGRMRDRNHTIYGVLNRRAYPSVASEDFAAIGAPLNRARRVAGVIDLVAGDERLFEYTLDTRAQEEKAEAFARFRALIAALRTRADAVIIDSNPCATFLTRLAIACADHIVAPVRPEKYSLTGLNMLEHVVREVRGRALRPNEFSVLLNGVNDRARSSETGDADAMTRNELQAAPFFGSALLEDEIPYSAVLRSAPSDRFAANPINVTAMMRVGGRSAKEALTRAAAAILKRAAA